MHKQSMTLAELLDWEDDWYDRDDYEEGDERNAWLEEGIEFYKSLSKLTEKSLDIRLCWQTNIKCE